jgi:hypothetical protein
MIRAAKWEGDIHGWLSSVKWRDKDMIFFINTVIAVLLHKER